MDTKWLIMSTLPLFMHTDILHISGYIKRYVNITLIIKIKCKTLNNQFLKDRHWSAPSQEIHDFQYSFNTWEILIVSNDIVGFKKCYQYHKQFCV